MKHNLTLFAALMLSSATAINAAETQTSERAPLNLPKPDGKPADMSKPVKVFIMFGQSNMVGMGAITRGSKHTLENAAKTEGLYPFLLDDAGNWSERNDVRHILIVQGGPKKDLAHNEWLRVGAGKWKMAAFIGVEHSIGHLLGNAYADPVMLLKCCNGNRSLGYDLLPPGSKGYDFAVTEKKDKKDKKNKETVDTTYTYAGFGQGPMRWVKGTTPEPVKKDAHVHAGEQYDFDVGNAKEVLAKLDSYYPGAKGCEVAGFFFWQGEADSGDPGLSAHYEENLVSFIKSVRKDFNAPNAKFVLATLGECVKGMQVTNVQSITNNRAQVLSAHLAVDGSSGKYPEFKNNVATIYTHDMAQGGEGNAHYGKNAEVYMDVGLAMGEAMLKLLKDDGK